MTTATQRPSPAPTPSSISTVDRRAPQPGSRTLTSGWYDPDGAAWEADRGPVFETFRVTPIRASLRVDVTDSDIDN